MAIWSRSSRSILFVVAACSGSTPAPTPNGPPATVVAVPLTAATAQIAKPGVDHQDVGAPYALTASDGSGLSLVRVEAKAVLEGPLAFTELHLYFHNAENRRREGTFQITLPPHAAVSRFAMENEGRWMEAEVVEKQIARRAYDDFLHRRQDPALLEKAPGNQFTAKVFPIAPNADKHLVISFSQELPGARYVLPLRGLPEVGKVDVQLAVVGADGKPVTEQLSRKSWTPDRDFVSAAATTPAAVESGTLVAAQVSVFDQGAGAVDTPTAMTLLVDTSASRGLGYESYVHSVRALVAKLAAQYKGLAIKVVAFDQDSEVVYDGAATSYSEAVDRKLLDRGAAGASDLGQAIASLQGHHQRVVVVTDGVVTAGADRAELLARIKKLDGAQRLDVVLAGGIRDDELATAIVRSGLPHAGAVLELDDTDGTAVALGEPVMVDIPVDVAGAAWVYPHTISSARPGTSTMVYARMAKPTQSLQINLGGTSRTYGVTLGTGPLVERAVAGAEIGELEQKLATADAKDAAALRADIAKRSVAARVVSSQTSLLVLESDADYARYGIDRKALADVLVVQGGHIDRLHREAPQQIAQPDPTVTATTNLPRQKNKGEAKKEALAFDGNADISAGFDTAMALDEGKMGKKDSDRADAGEAEIGAMTGHAGAPGGARGGDTRTPGPMQPAMEAPPPPPPAPTMRPEPRPTASPAHVADRVQAIETARNSGVLGTTAQGGGGAGIADGQYAVRTEIADDNSNEDRQPWPPKDAPAALHGPLSDIEAALAHHDVDGALAKARDWHAREPGDVLALIGLGDALEAKGAAPTAARIYGSIIDLYPGRADLRRFAGERLARVVKQQPATQSLIVDTLQRAVADRPDHLTGHRQLAYALLRAGKPAEAFTAILAAIDRPYRSDSYLGAQRVLADDAGMLGAALIAAAPNKRAEVVAELDKRHLKLATSASTRFILYWETDGNDVDFHIQDARGNHAFYGHKQLASGGELYADITTGYGPECFAIQGQPKAGPYRLSINYYSQGPMGYGMGLLEVQKFDGKGGLTFEDRPYVIMADHAYVDLGKI